MSLLFNQTCLNEILLPFYARTHPHTNTSNCAITYHPLRKLSKLNELDMQDTAGEVGTRS